MVLAWLMIQALMMTILEGDTPARMKGVARAVTQVVHTLAVLEQGETALAKFCVVETGHVAGGGGITAGGGITVGGIRAGGGGLTEQLLSAPSEAALTPAVRMAAAWALMQTPSVTLSVGDTPAMTKGVARAVRQVVQALAVLAQGETAAAKFCVVDTGQVGAAGGGGESEQELRAPSATGLTPALIAVAA
jgi:hypothetical protein